MNPGILTPPSQFATMPLGLLGRPTPVPMIDYKSLLDPSTIAGLSLWLDANDMATLGPTAGGAGPVSNNGPVKYWGDKSGNGRHVANSGADSVCPTFVRNYHQGRSGIFFDGGDVLSRSSLGLQVAPATFFLAIDNTARVQYAGLLVCSPSSGDDFSQNAAAIIAAHDNPPGVDPFFYGGNTNAGGNAALQTTQGSYNNIAAGKRVVCAYSTRSTGSIRVNGMEGNADTAHTLSGTSAGIVVGGRYLGGSIHAGFRFTGRILEVMAYSRTLSAVEISAMERYLGAKWGMAIA